MAPVGGSLQLAARACGRADALAPEELRSLLDAALARLTAASRTAATRASIAARSPTADGPSPAIRTAAAALAKRRGVLWRRALRQRDEERRREHVAGAEVVARPLDAWNRHERAAAAAEQQLRRAVGVGHGHQRTAPSVAALVQPAQQCATAVALDRADHDRIAALGQQRGVQRSRQHRRAEARPGAHEALRRQARRSPRARASVRRSRARPARDAGCACRPSARPSHPPTPACAGDVRRAVAARSTSPASSCSARSARPARARRRRVRAALDLCDRAARDDARAPAQARCLQRAVEGAPARAARPVGHHIGRHVPHRGVVAGHPLMRIPNRMTPAVCCAC